jgi:hypothetical protein
VILITSHQEKWLAPYINFITSKRAKAQNDFEKDFYKLMNDAVFGKTTIWVKKFPRRGTPRGNDRGAKKSGYKKETARRAKKAKDEEITKAKEKQKRVQDGFDTLGNSSLVLGEVVGGIAARARVSFPIAHTRG